ncbi:GGDEF domain-containing protein [Clostridium sp. Sa3CUN1]|uniref:GGDEF domain-containing protein n=1 Tax=Clostridium gallinarum TaxID=2762246 RepID=A0ABR8Q6A3_9CLOT|nr:GGDEF domain-containing protein [Clostridium gallinarum]MBD7915963.1 GGDEF domain-containing protein [Clostridium gallinarum]
MEKIILKKIVLIIISIFTIGFLISSAIILYMRSNSVEKDLLEMISQIEISNEQIQVNLEDNLKLFKEDYLNRTYAIDYILSNNKENLNKEALNEIKDLMKVDEIHVVDNNGIVVFSSEEESIGIDLLKSKEGYSFWNLIKNNDENENIVQLNATKILDGTEKIYIGVKSSLEEYSIVQIALDKEVLDDWLREYSLKYVIDNTPTVYEKAIFLVNKETGVLESITKNNEQEINIKNVNSNEEFVNKLYSLTDGEIVKINDKYRYVKTKILNDYIIGSYVDIDRVYKVIVLQILFFTLILIIVLGSMIYIFKNSIKKYILKDIDNIRETIRKLMDGDYLVEFSTKYDTELKDITHILNDWKASYKYKSERMSRLMSTINSQSAIFECLYVINRNFFSDNIKEILGIDDENWREISKTPKSFEKYIRSIENNNGIVNINNRFLKIISFKREDEFYGMIIDKTDDEEFKNKIKKDSETDVLTNLLNRSGLENRVKNIFEDDNENGILIIFDLDNFKLVNDDLGHPVGDEVLKIFSRCLEECFRKNDIISRIGGDEFIVFINNNIEINNLTNKLNYLLNNIRKELKLYYEKYKLSTSIGVAYRSDEFNTYDKLYKEADKALYEAKRLGKNRFYIM